MPIKRRTAKAHQLTEFLIEDLHYGPGACLFNGCGYLADFDDGFWRDKSPEVQAIVLERMRSDWFRHHRAVMNAWERRTPHDLQIAAKYHGNPVKPWAQSEFGDPEQERTR